MKSIKVNVPIKERVKWVLIQTTVPSELAKQINALAKTRRMSRSQYVREVLSRVIDN